jgi:outer membrane protein assembly factor BamB
MIIRMPSFVTAVRKRTPLLVVLLTALAGFTVVHANDWPEWRGASRNGVSSETNLPSSWSPGGENVAWSLPIGGRATPVVFGNRLYLQTTTDGDTSRTQERLVAIDVESGKVVWEHRFNIYLSDVPQHRAGWASPAVDPQTGNIYVFTVAAELTALSPDGTVVWSRSLPEEYGAITTHGGRTTPPIIEGDKVILNAFLMGWGDFARPSNRYFAFDTRTGHTIWVSSPQTRHYDTNFSSPIVATVGNTRMLIVGGTDGAFHAIQLNTGKPVWSLEVSKRAILNSALFHNGTVYITHGEENIDTTQMGMVAAVDPAGAGALTGSAIKWATLGFLPTFASPVIDGTRLYSVDNGAVLAAFDLSTGSQLWTRQLGTLQKGSPVFADGKLYLGTENGKFYVLRPSATGAEIVDEDLIGAPGHPEPVVASPAIADGRIYVVTMGPPTLDGAPGHLFAIGTRRPRTAATRPTGGAGTPAQAAGPVAQVQVLPQEWVSAPGQAQKFSVKLFDANGNFVRDAAPGSVQWTLDQLQGTVAADGTYTAPAGGSAGYVKATVDGAAGQARVRVIPPLPWSLDFEGAKAPMGWWTAHLKLNAAPLDGGTAMRRPRDDTVGRRAKIIMGRPEWSGYTVEADVRGTESRRQRGDIGIINQRYVLVIFGNTQKIELQPWQAADEMTVHAPFTWALDTWYRMKLRVENRNDGTTLVQGKVWKKGDPEPAAWTVEKVDPIGHRHGAPGLYADGYSDMFFDNVAVYPNK